MVYRQDCASGFRGQLDSPGLGRQEIEDTVFLSIQDASVGAVLYQIVSTCKPHLVIQFCCSTYLNVNTGIAILTLVMGGI